MRSREVLASIIRAQYGSSFGWLPVGLACGIGLYFSLRFEPSSILLSGIGAAGLALAYAAYKGGEFVKPFAIFTMMACLGFDLAAWRAHSVLSPALTWRYYGPIEGRIIKMDRSSSDALRLTLDQVRLDRVSQARTPERVRISLHGDANYNVVPEPGLRVMTTGHLSPPSGPIEPGGFDFQRHAFFNKLGAVGYTRIPVLALEPAQRDLTLWVFQTRMAISQRITQVLPGDVGGFAAAVTTGDRSAISTEGLTALRASNTAHLLAISGLHMGLLSGFVFGALRVAFALVSSIGMRVPARKIAAAGALVVSAGYLMMSGGNVATERAFIMVAVALCAILLNRRAISLRAVAMAALIVLFLRPEALMGPGFQMSFAATSALVAVFGLIRDYEINLGPKWAKPFVAVVVSSVVAGLATAPIGAAHFNTMAHYGLLANLLSVPLMGVLVVPAAVLAFVLAPFGLDAVGLWAMGVGLRWILRVSDWVSNLEGARGYVAGPSGWVLPTLAFGAVFLMLWRGRSRFLGLGVMVSAFVMWNLGARPVALIADNGSLVGVMTQQGRALSKAKGAAFVARNWLENDGDPASQDWAAERWGKGALDSKTARVGNQEVIHLIGKRAVAAVQSCGKDQLLVASVEADHSIQGCMVFDPNTLRATGSIGFYQKGGEIIMRSARDLTGDRLWSNWPKG